MTELNKYKQIIKLNLKPLLNIAYVIRRFLNTKRNEKTRSKN